MARASPQSAILDEGFVTPVVFAPEHFALGV